MEPGGRTRGVGSWPGGTDDLASGRDSTHDQVVELLRRIRPLPGGAIPATAGDVELKFAMKMRIADIKVARLMINHKGGPCPGPFGCDQLLPKVLPPGARLTVYWPGGQKTYRGEGENP